MKKQERDQSDDKVTIRKHSKPLQFTIYYQHEQVLKHSCKTTMTVGQFIDEVRHKLVKRFDNFIGLTSTHQNQILDFTLTNPNYLISNYRNRQCFQILLEEIVKDYSGPTLDDFTFLKCLGSGVSAEVFLVRHNSNGQMYALKQIKKEYFKQFSRVEGILREKKIMCEMINELQFVTKLYGTFESSSHLNLLLEFYPGGELFYHLSLKKFNEDEARLCFAEVVLTMEQLHAKKIIYRDLKPENIMVDFDGHLRIGDFGMCKINLDKEDLTYTRCGSPQYMAPELKNQEGYNYSADFYTMGALLYELVMGVPPYYQGAPLTFPPFLTEDFIDLVAKLIEEEVSLRMTNYNELKSARWFKNINWLKVHKKQYKMPIKLHPYKSYIHDEFKQYQINNNELKEEVKYDQLFDMFFYLNPSKHGIAGYYPYSHHHQKKIERSIKSNKSLKSVKSQKNLKDKSQNQSKSRNVSQKSDRSKNSNSKTSSKSTSQQKHFFKRQPLPTTNIYTNFGFTSPPKQLTFQNEGSVKNKSKPKNMFQEILERKKSPIKFKKIQQVRSGKNVGIGEKMKEVGKTFSKGKFYN